MEYNIMHQESVRPVFQKKTPPVLGANKKAELLKLRFNKSFEKSFFPKRSMTRPL
jgi:hypothetical protein